MIDIKDDSRKIKKGDTFIALRGISSDGHSYVDTAIKNGATKVIVEEGEYEVTTLKVEDTREYLKKYLFEKYLPLISKMKLIGITGTNGKTTCAYLVQKLLNNIGSKTAYIGTIGYYIDEKKMSLSNTTPDLCLLYELLMDAYNNGCENVVMEISSEGLAMGRAEGLEFDYAAFTNLTPEHLNYHKTMENYALAKQLLFKRLRNDKVAIINADDKYSDYFLLDGNKNITYGKNKGDYQLVNYEVDGITHFEYEISKENKTVKSRTKLLGEYNLYNVMLVFALLNEMGYENFDKYLYELEAPKGRMQCIDYNGLKVIVDYAHTPDALVKALEVIRTIVKGKIYTVIGATGERDVANRPITGEIATTLSDYVIFTNDSPKGEDEMKILNDLRSNVKRKNHETIVERAEAIDHGLTLLGKDDCLVILGKGHEEFVEIKGVKLPFNDCDYVINKKKLCK